MRQKSLTILYFKSNSTQLSTLNSQISLLPLLLRSSNMPTPPNIVLLLSLSTLLLISLFSLSSCNPIQKEVNVDVEEEDLSFLEEADDTSSSHLHRHDPTHSDGEDDSYDDDFGGFSGHDEPEANQEAYKHPQVDDKDVVVLIERNFSDVVENNKFVMVEFYAPWCGHCQALAPEYAAAATELKAENVVLAKVDATVENELAHGYDVQGFPTVLFFVDGVHKPYTGGRTK